MGVEAGAGSARIIPQQDGERMTTIQQDRLAAWLAGSRVQHRLIEVPGHTRTAAAAAQALGVPLRVIVKSLVCLAGGRPTLALVPGDRELSLAKLAQICGAADAILAPRRRVVELTGYEAGGVAPVGLLSPLPVLADELLRSAESVFCGGGTASRMLELHLPDLVRLTGLTWHGLSEDGR